MDVLQALETLAAHFEDDAKAWDRTADIAKAKDKDFYRGLARGSGKAAAQLRGLLYELQNPPFGPWDSLGHKESEESDWLEGHPLTSYDDEGHRIVGAAFYR